MPTYRTCANGDCSRFEQRTDSKYCTVCGDATEWRSRPIHQTSPAPSPPASDPGGASTAAAELPLPQLTYRRRRRSVAWIYYGILAVLVLFSIPAIGVSGFLVAVLLGAYATYLFRGGRIVIWFW